MKRIVIFVLILVLIITLVPCNILATTNDIETLHFDDGSYITIKMQIVESRATSTKSASKTYTYKNGDGVEEWRAVLSGTFTYTGTSATCTSSSCSVTITDSAWYQVSKTVNKSGASALAELTMGRKVLGITYTKKTINMSITCSPNGSLS